VVDLLVAVLKDTPGRKVEQMVVAGSSAK